MRKKATPHENVIVLKFVDQFEAMPAAEFAKLAAKFTDTENLTLTPESLGRIKAIRIIQNQRRILATMPRR